MKITTPCLLLAAMLAMPASLVAQGAHPDFNGTWVLDPAKTSATGMLPAPASGQYVIVQRGDTFTVDQHTVSEQGDLIMKKVWATDGKSWRNSMSYQGNEMLLNSVLEWKGTVLNIYTSTEFQSTPVEQDEVWTMAPDGKTFTVYISTVVGGQEVASGTMVFVKK